MESPETILERVRKYWRISDDHLPLPRLNLLHDGHPEGLHVRFWKYHHKALARSTPLRCDVSAKCRGCGAVVTFGLIVPQSHYDRFAGNGFYDPHLVDIYGNERSV